MSFAIVFSSILTLIAGIGIFLIACQMMSSNLESASSDKLKSLFSKASHNKLVGVGIGTVGTAAIQSSGATTVMVIGFVNAGIMSLTQAATIIYGANIGTTVTAQIVALGMFGENAISTTIIFSAFAGIGAFVTLFSKQDLIKKIGGIMTGFGMLFVGLEMMSGSMADFAELDSVKLFLAGIDNIILLVVIGAILTAVIQSSSVMTSVAIAMVFTGLITLNQGIFLTMGSNIGSCVVALIAGMTSSKNAKRTALIHLFFNVSGVLVFLVAYAILKYFFGITFGGIFESLFPNVPQTQLAMFHTIFNVATVILILPFTNALVKAVSRIISDTDDAVDDKTLKLFYIDDNMLKTPSVAVQQTKNEIVNMAKIAHDNFNLSLDIISTMDLSDVETFRYNENELNFLNNGIVDFAVKLSQSKRLNQKDNVYLSTVFRTVRDIERIGDYAENIVEYAQKLKESNNKFSPDALREIKEIRALIETLGDYVMKAYVEEDVNAFALAENVEERIDDFTKEMEDNHIWRMSEGLCNPTTGAEYLSLSSNAERVADHWLNVGKTVKYRNLKL